MEVATERTAGTTETRDKNKTGTSSTKYAAWKLHYIQGGKKHGSTA